MGIYNPHLPRILGQEWVPIRNEDQIYSPAVNAVETGHGFAIGATTNITSGRFYVKDLPPAQTQGQVYEVGIYPNGKEPLSGPIRTVIIPCNAGGVTGGGFAGLTAANIPIFLASSADNSWIECTPNADANPKTIDLFFATNGYAQLLNGKRILGVNLLHSFSWQPFQAGVAGSIASATVQFTSAQALEIWTGAGTTRAAVFAPIVETYGSNLLALNPPQGRPPQAVPLSRVKFGEVNHLWQTPSNVITSDRVPWRYNELQRFEATSGSNRYRVHYDFGGTTEWAGVFYLNYAALEIVYCEEQRVGWGLTSFNDSFSGSNSKINIGVNGVTMRDTSLNAPLVLPAGDYTTVLSCPDLGDLQGAQGAQVSQPAAANTYATLNAVRELYQIPPHPGVQVNIPSPPEDHVGDVFTKTETLILPQISLHTSGGVMPEVHVYGRQAIAQVWGTVTATQEIYDAGMASTASYPQVRFYARRFGNTTVPLNLTYVAIPTIQTSITPSVFDDLEEIVDGWKEVTLTFAAPPTLGGGTNPQWSFSATGELAGNRWEVLGAAAPAISGVPGNTLQLAAASDQLYASTYGAPVSGAAINWGWISGIAPLVSATTDDRASDGVLIFSQDMPTVTGMSVTVLNQAVSGIGQDCGINPVYIPSQIQYNSISWPAQQAFTVFDNFSRVSASGWGTATSGQTWTLNGGAAGDYTVDGSSGLVTLGASGSSRHTSVLTNTFLDIDGYGQISMTTLPTVAMTWGSLTWHKESATNDMYQAEIDFLTDSSVALAIRKWVAGVDTVLATITIGYQYVLGTKYNIRIQQRGFNIRARAWLDGTDEPAYWQLDVADFDLTDPAGVGTRTRIDAGGGTPQVVLYDNITFTDPNFGAFELQRMDTVDTTWQTIMLATSATVSGFNDFEARVGLLSSYRIRMLNVLNFTGPWSSTVTSTIPEPGVTGTAITADTAVLIFTSNERQNGSINLAYCNAWEGSVNEEFTFPEATFVQLQAMYNKDFFTAFRPLERGGERFNRTVLVQAAAISPPTLADFTSLRDMAWDSVNYICVRDQEGNRWFATVLVPSGRVRHFRRLYMAEVDIIEVTDTPTPVNP